MPRSIFVFSSAVLSLSLVGPSVAQVDVAELEEQAMKDAVARVAPAVVRIETFGGLESVSGLVEGPSPTTGLVVSQDGHILSSAFNFVQRPASIIVTLPSGKKSVAQIVVRDKSRMLVLLKVDSPTVLPVPESVGRDQMRVGQWAIAVGRTFEVSQPNVSAGIISALDRIWGRAIQTDARISPTNYGGPLVDIYGRVLGILVPLSPQSREEVAGAEWYDSGIGFAVPLTDILPHLATLKRGDDLHPGLLGITLKGKDVYGDPAIVATVQAKSPAAEAGLEVGDRIVRINGASVERQAQLKHMLGALYAGEQTDLQIQRQEQLLEFSASLAAELEPFEHAFLGFLPQRHADGNQLLVRYVYAESPAAKAGLKVGDRVMRINDRAVNTADSAREVLAAFEAGQQLTLSWESSGASQSQELTLDALPRDIPASLPPPHEGDLPNDLLRPPTGLNPVEIPEMANECFAYVPETYDPRVAHGVLVWLHSTGELDTDELVALWQSHCEARDLILVMPRSINATMWQPTESAFIRKCIEDVKFNYQVDASRVVVAGRQASGVMASLTAFEHREVIAGVAMVDAPVPRRVSLPPNDPIQRLAIFCARSSATRWATRIDAGVKLLREMKYPVSVKPLGEQPRALKDEDLAELSRWIDTLDRL